MTRLKLSGENTSGWQPLWMIAGPAVADRAVDHLGYTCYPMVILQPTSLEISILPAVVLYHM